jgi:hypothetical protein
MRHSLHSHIIYLENKIQSLKERLTGSHFTDEERQSMESQVYHAEMALKHYREAYLLELSVSNPESPGSPGSKSKGGNGSPAIPKSETRKKEGIVARARKRGGLGMPHGSLRYRDRACARLR